MERAGEGHAAGGIPADLIRAFWHQGWNLKVSPAGQREGEALTDEFNVSDKTKPVPLAVASNKQSRRDAKSHGDGSTAGRIAIADKQDDKPD